MGMAGSSTAPVLVALHRVGPYHHARFESTSEALEQPLVVLETRPDSQEYPWICEFGSISYQLIHLYGSLDPEQDPPLASVRQQLKTIINQWSPAVIVTVGWADSVYLELLRLGQEQDIPLIVISDSRRIDMPRIFWKEWVKSLLLQGYSAAVVAGSQSRQYLVELGFKPSAIFQPWDVVDNQKFLQIAAQTHHESAAARPFLCVARLIPEKNHALLLQAYGAYQDEGGCRPLVLVGDGPLHHEIQGSIANLSDPSQVTIQPFEQLHSLAARYANAHALLLPSRKDTWGLVVNEAMAAGLPVIVSSACGCSVDLICDGISGWRFETESSESLLSCLRAADQQPPEARQRMIQAARKRLSDFSPDSFSCGLGQACEYAVASKARSRLSQVLAGWLANKP